MHRFDAARWMNRCCSRMLIRCRLQGISELLVPLVHDLDVSVLAVRESQIDLFKEIDRLSSELQKFVEVSKMPALEPYVQKLNNSRRRVQAVNHNLRAIQERLDRLYSAASRRRPQQYVQS